eukprot:m51a1_g11928 DNA replication licensing factor MCM7 (715) ;mRNA; r:688735-691519
MADLKSYYSESDPKLVKDFERNALRYVTLTASVVQSMLPTPEAGSAAATCPDVIDVLTAHREARHDEAVEMTLAAAPSVPANMVLPQAPAYPEELARRFEVQVCKGAAEKVTALRSVRAKNLGKLVVVRGIVTRASEVRPMARVVTYTCDQCHCEVYQEVPGRTFAPIERCLSSVCREHRSPGLLYMQTRGSKFVKFQELRIQELMEQVPMGHTPRSVSVHCRGELTHLCAPGDIITITGIFLPAPVSTGRGTRFGMVTETYIEALNIEQGKKGYSTADVDAEHAAAVEAIHSRRDVYAKLARSIAPEIFGLEDVKKALLLQMVGAPTRVLRDGMRIRGDINVMLMGDPGVAKSQLLKHVSAVAPRAVYTTGKGSSGVGLMAAVVRDTTTSEFVLEGGSLVLADMGVCCIDEFDKMDEGDRTAIHEVMEQQTISIAKAGITTTLNARTAILAAANPVYGRYNPSRPPSENINLPAALLSRFDLLFILLDNPDQASDRALGDHIVAMHMKASSVSGAAAEAKATKTSTPEPLPPLEELAEAPFFRPSLLRAFIAIARERCPTLPRDLTEYAVTAYVNMRKAEGNLTEGFYYTCARSLLAILRLSLALARLRFADEVSRGDLNEAMRLMSASKAQVVERASRKKRDAGPRTDVKSALYDIARECASQTGEVSIDTLQQQAVVKGFSKAQIDSMVLEYTGLGVMSVSDGTIHFVDWK